MLSHLDCIIFPDRCEVIEVVPSQRYVYPIFKNGSSSLHYYARKNHCRILINEQIKKITSIDIVLRDPQQRMHSGIRTFVHTIERDHPELDSNTVAWFAQNYLFLNRHYAPQLLWLVNLARYIDPNTNLNFYGMHDLDMIVKTHQEPHKISLNTQSVIDRLSINPNNEMYDRIEQILVGCIGQQMKFNQLIDLIKLKDTTAYEFVIGRSQRIIDPIYALPKT